MKSREPTASAVPVRRARGFALLFLIVCAPTMAIDLETLWDFGNPEASEQRMRVALAAAKGDDALILETQIARTYSLRKDFDTARKLLHGIEASIAKAGAQAQVRYQLELGRTFVSAAHKPDAVTPESKAQARQCWEKALNTARASGLDALAIDAIHMFAFVDTAPADQLKWGEAALEVSRGSSQEDARRWEASIRNNVGYALHQLGRLDEALTQFQQALVLREQRADAGATRVARWMVAWTLRSLKRHEEALAIQLRLEKENDAAGKPDPYVFEELEALYTAMGDPARAERYASLKGTARKP
jgi:tetratricopeptide (TPR) repeat protein